MENKKIHLSAYLLFTNCSKDKLHATELRMILLFIPYFLFQLYISSLNSQWFYKKCVQQVKYNGVLKTSSQNSKNISIGSTPYLKKNVRKESVVGHECVMKPTSAFAHLIVFLLWNLVGCYLLVFSDYCQWKILKSSLWCALLLF